MANLNEILTGWRNSMTVKAKPWAYLLIACFLFLTGEARTEEQASSEQQIKAAYLYKFGNYVDWPDRAFASPSSPFTIGVMGADALADELAQLVPGHVIGGRQVIVRKLHREDQISGLNVLFIGKSNSGRLADILAMTKGHPILIVTEADEALSRGSMINFVTVDGKVRFEAAPKSASLGNLSISARLLAAAYRVAGAS
jgi:hypothetical protein